MSGERSVLVVNTSSNAANHSAAAYACAGMLSTYVRPYIIKGRWWERKLASSKRAGPAFKRSFGRRKLLPGLSAGQVHEAALPSDFSLAFLNGLGVTNRRVRAVWVRLVEARIRAIAAAGGHQFSGEPVVFASWGSAEPAFELQRKAGGLCLLNYPITHHDFTRRFLDDEADREPAFADTLGRDLDSGPAWLRRRWRREIEMADHILLGSSFARQTFIDEGVPEDKLEVVHYGANTAMFRPPEGGRDAAGIFRLLFVGQIGQRKGISYLLRAYQRFHGPDTRLTLVGTIQGDGSALRPWQSLFTHIPHLPHAALAEAYADADVFVFPSLIEGLGLVVLEAMASGLPVITTSNGPGDIVRDGVDGFVVPARDEAAIEECLSMLRDQPELRAEMGRNARDRAQDFTWDAYRQTIVSKTSGWIKAMG